MVPFLSQIAVLASHKFESGIFDVRCVATDLQITRQTSAEDNEEGEEGEREDALPSSSSNNPNSLSKMRRLALCSSVSTPSFSLYDIDAKQVIGKFIGHTATVTTIKRDGDLVVRLDPPWSGSFSLIWRHGWCCLQLSGGDDQTIRVWELATLKCIHVFSLEGIVYDIRLCENKLVTGVTGMRLPPVVCLLGYWEARPTEHCTAGSHMSFLRIWDYTSRAHLLDVKITDLPRRIFSITVLPDRIYCCTKEQITVVDFHEKGEWIIFTLPTLVVVDASLVQTWRSNKHPSVPKGGELAGKTVHSSRALQLCLVQSFFLLSALSLHLNKVFSS